MDSVTWSIAYILTLLHQTESSSEGVLYLFYHCFYFPFDVEDLQLVRRGCYRNLEPAIMYSPITYRFCTQPTKSSLPFLLSIKTP